MLSSLNNIIWYLMCGAMIISGVVRIYSSRSIKKSFYYENLKIKIEENKAKFNFFNSHERYLIDDEVRAKVYRIDGIAGLTFGILILVIGLIELKWTSLLSSSGFSFAFVILVIWMAAEGVWYKLYPEVLYLRKHGKQANNSESNI